MLIDVQSAFQPGKRFFYTKHTLSADGFDSLRKFFKQFFSGTFIAADICIATIVRITNMQAGFQGNTPFRFYYT